MTIESEIKRWDGKSKDKINTIYIEHSNRPEFLDRVIKLLSNVSCQKGATWLIKAWLKNGRVMDKKHNDDIYHCLAVLEHWESKLHILQSLPHLSVSKQNVKVLEAFLRLALSDTNKFVRAWAYNGFYLLAQYFPEYQKEVESFFRMAMKDEAASVQARIRNFLKQGF